MRAHIFSTSSRMLMIVLFLFISGLQAGTTGKIAGFVHDADTGDPLIGCNVIVDGSTYGASVGLDGDFFITGLPPGNYSVTATMIGYQALRKTDVMVSVDLTTPLNFELGTQILEAGQVVTVTAERPLVVKDLTSSASHISSKELEAMPVETFGEVLEMQAGVVDGHIRGGRHGETLYMIDGIPVTDPYDGSMAVDIENASIQELQLITGAFNAEYGQAMSGVVNIVTKDGNDDFEWNVMGYAGDHLSSNSGIFRNIDSFKPLSQHNLQANFSGPIIPGKLTMFGTVRRFVAEGHLAGVRQYNIDDTFYDEIDPTSGLSGEGKWWLKGTYTGGSDSIAAGSIGYTPLELDSLMAFQEAGYRLGTGDSAFVPMNPYEKTSYHVKFTFKLTPRLALRLNLLQDQSYQRGWDEGMQLNPDAILHRYKDGSSVTFSVNHQLTERTFYQLGYSRVEYEWQQYKYKSQFAFSDSTDTDDDGVVDAINDDRQDIALVNALSTQQLYSYFTGGIHNSWFNRRTNSQVFKADITSQLSRVVELKAGAQARLDDIYRLFYSYDTQTGKPFGFDLAVNPMELSAYGQTKLEFKSLIVNAGLRFDYFNSDGSLPVDPRDPDAYSPIKPEHRWKDADGDGHIDDSEPFVDADSSGSWSIGETYTDVDNDGVYDLSEKTDANRFTEAERLAFWYTKATPKWQISPRIGIGYPISDRGVIHVSYGHFFQIPNLEDLFNNPEYRMNSGTGLVNTLMGNPDLEPQQTISYEIGLQQELTDDFGINVNFYFRDIRNLISADKVVLTYDQRKYAMYVNRDYANTRGVTLSFEKRYSQMWMANVDYTFQISEGNASDPNAAFYARQGDSEPEVRLLRLDWDQRHSLNSNITIGNLEDWGLSFNARLGSGLPYTPSDDQGNLGVATPNSETKPFTQMYDLKVYKNLVVAGFRMNVYAKLDNVFDTMNQYGVYGDTGTSEYTLSQLRAESNNAIEAINTLDDYFMHQTWYAEPRRFTVGFSIGGR
ncbi:MAG: TonB-dependent receptor [Candidatus Marinimicrobia bacterium]|nr:TonB-dependent receptor [Candidatus Neomarinimicrobiota bacterium]